jgi:hypothetical protein
VREEFVSSEIATAFFLRAGVERLLVVQERVDSAESDHAQRAKWSRPALGAAFGKRALTTSSLICQWNPHCTMDSALLILQPM